MSQTQIHENLRVLLEPREGPCLSLFVPTHRRFPENQQDVIRFKNLLRDLEEALLKQHPAKEADGLLQPFRALVSNNDFWNHAWDGLAVLAAPGFSQVIKLQQTVPELTVVASSFHLKPLLRAWQMTGRYQVLCVNRKQIRLFEGDRDHLDEVKLDPEVPETKVEALGEQLTEPHQTVSSYGGGTAPGGAMHHGHGGKSPEIEIDEERYFRAVDRAIIEHHSRPSGLPLILAALPQHQTTFRELSHNSLIAEKGIEIDATALSVDQIRERAWNILEPQIRSRIEKITEQFGGAQAKGLGTDDLAILGMAAAESRVSSLLVEEGRHIPGTLDPTTGSISLQKDGDPPADDLLDDLAELVLRRGGTVAVLPAADMPATTGVAAIYRF